MQALTRSSRTETRGELWTLAAPIVLAGWSVIDGYQLLRLVRRTPSIDVYLARHLATNSHREVVVIQRLWGVDQVAKRRAVEAEVLAARAVDHPGVARVEDVGLTGDGHLYVATARPAGPSLSEMLAEDGVPAAARARALGLAVVDAVAAAHALGVLHGRLNLDSVVVVPPQGDGPERPVVLGFGTVAAHGAVLLPGALPDEHYPFVSPERAAGGPPSVPDDVFALGSVMLSLLTGELPAPMRPAARPAPVDPAPQDVLGVAQRARAADASQRYTSVGTFGAALGAVDGAGLPSPRPLVAPVRTPSAGGLAVASPVSSLAPVRPDVRALPATALPASGALRRRRALLAAGVALMVGGAGAAASAWRVRAMRAVTSPLDESARVPAPAVAVRPAPTAPVTAAPVAAAPVQAAAAAPVTRKASGAAVAPPVSAPSRVAAPSAPPPGMESVTRPAETRVAAVPAPASADGEVVAAGPREVRARASASGGASPGDAAAEAARNEAAGAEAARAEAGVRAAVAEYANAIEARDLGMLGRVYPGMTEPQRRAWATFFGSVADLRARLAVDDIRTSGATVQVRVRGTYEYQNLRPHRAERTPVSFTAILARDASGWRVRAVE